MNTCIWRNMAACLFLAGIMLPCLAFADQLIMKNGDVITGDVSKVEGNEVYIKPAYGSAFTVDLAEVVSINAEKVFEMELEDGSEVNARFAGSPDEGMQTLIVDGAQVTVGMMEVRQAAQPRVHYERVSHIDLNMTFNDGNTDSKNNLLFADTRVRVGDHRHLAALTIRRDETNDISTKKQDLFVYTYNWMFNEPWYIGATASYERDPIKDLSHRYTIGAIVGRDIFKDSRKFLTASVGIGYSDQKLAGIADSGATGLWNMIYEHNFRDGDIALFHNNSVDYQFYGNNNLILKTNTGFRFDIIAKVYASIALRYDHESDPAPGAENYDTTLAVGIGAEF